MYKIWKGYRDFPFILKMIIGFIMGIIIGFIFGPSAKVLSPLGDLFLNLLNMIILPLILFTLISAVNSTSSKGLGRIGVKIFVYYFLSTAVAVVIGILLSLLINPGKGLSLPRGEDVDIPDSPSFIDTLLSIVPENIIEAFADDNVLSIVFVAVIGGMAISTMRNANEDVIKNGGVSLLNLMDAGSELTFRILKGILQYAPIGVFGIAASAIGEQGFEVLSSLGGYVGASYAGVVVLIFFVYAVILLVFKISPLKYFTYGKETLATAFMTASSLGTLPVTMRSAEKANISDSVAKFTLPIGATVNMNGSAIHFGVGAIFAANVMGINLNLPALIGVVLASTLAAIGTAGVPGAGLIGLSIVLTQAGLPIEIVGLTAGVNVITDMAFTAGNVTGDLVGAAVVDKSEKKHTEAHSNI